MKDRNLEQMRVTYVLQLPIDEDALQIPWNVLVYA